LLGVGLGANDDPFQVKILNDTSQMVIDHGYFVTLPGTSDGGGPVTLPPGRSFEEPEFANEGVDQDRITTLGNKTLGCLPFQFSKNPPIVLVVKISEMVRCRTINPITGAESKTDWPDPKF
jgi:hypothetical protein